LRAEPKVISVPAVDKRPDYSVQLIDGNTCNHGYIGSRAAGSEPGHYMLVGADWKGATPPGIRKVFTSTTPFALRAIRTQLFNAKDMPERGEGASTAPGSPGSASARARPSISRIFLCSTRPPSVRD
jgi:hypothetical protein